MGDDQLANVEAAYVALLTGTCDDVHETVRRTYSNDASIQGIMCDAEGVHNVTKWWQVTQAVCRPQNVAITKRVISTRHDNQRILFQIQYTAWVLYFIPTITMHVHVLLDVQGQSAPGTWQVVRHEEQILLEKIMVQLPGWRVLFYLLTPLVLRLLWLPVLNAAVRS